MARSQEKHLGPGRGSRAVTNVRRLWPFVLMAWERWQALPDHQKERYKRQAMEYAERGRQALDDYRRRKPER